MKLTIQRNLSEVAEQYRTMIDIAIDCMEEVIAHHRFYEILVEEYYLSGAVKGETSELRYLEPSAIHQRLFPIILTVRTYYTAKNVIGYGTPSDTITRVNTKYLTNYKPDSLPDLMNIGSNLLHEHSHDCGFSHDFFRTPRRKNSVSYMLNRVYERTFREVYSLPEEAKPVVVTPWYRRVLRWIF